jgi:hypothetical protein
MFKLNEKELNWLRGRPSGFYIIRGKCIGWLSESVKFTISNGIVYH